MSVNVSRVLGRNSLNSLSWAVLKSVGRGKQRRSLVSWALRAETAGPGPVKLAEAYASLIELSMLPMSFSKSEFLTRALVVMLTMF